MPRQQLDLNIVYEDDDLLVINKPAGLLVIPDRWDASKPTVVKLARAYLPGRPPPKAQLQRSHHASGWYIAWIETPAVCSSWPNPIEPMPHYHSSSNVARS